MITFEVLNQTSPNLQENITLMSLITFEVLNQSSPNLQGSCRSTCRWCLQNYMENGWELTSKLTSKLIAFKNTQSNFTLISLITFEGINETPPNLQAVTVIPADGACKITWKTVKNWRLNWRLNEKLLKILIQISH